MVTETMNAIDRCKECIDSHRSFVLQGGAGSGKTESLKELILYIKHSNPSAKVVCITHTNAAVNEIVSRVGDCYPISTIHSFIYGLIGKYKKNIKSVIPELFFVSPMVRLDQIDDISEADYKKAEYEKYKKLYGRYTNKLYTIFKEDCEKVVGKREYDKNPILYNQKLNDNIQALNRKITDIINTKDYSSIIYNETQFDSLIDLSYGHDGLLDIFHLLYKKFPTLGKIIADRFDYIFIDEYQDTRAEILNDIFDISSNQKLTIGLFGDSMQSIYDDGIGNIDDYIENKTIVAISKADNYRCSYEVIDFINSLRMDSISQAVALKKQSNGSYEIEADRHGIVKVLYTVTGCKPTARSSPEEKEQFQILINNLIIEAKRFAGSSKILVLTNKAIADKNGFKYLYKIFDDLYVNVNDRLENYLRSVQALDVSDLCSLFLKGEYNTLIKLVQKGGFKIHNTSDKKKLHDILNGIIENTNSSMLETVEAAINYKLIKRTETYNHISERNSHFLNQLKSDDAYQQFKTLYQNGNNTYHRIKDSIELTSEEEFNDYVSLWKRECFITNLFSPDLKFSEVLNYGKYLDEDTEYITMHKTKGTSIPSVIVVMEEYFWNEYDFSLLYRPNEQKNERKTASQKLIYVACSRAKNNLVCVRVLSSDEVEQFKKFFPQAEEVTINPCLKSEK